MRKFNYSLRVSVVTPIVGELRMLETPINAADYNAAVRFISGSSLFWERVTRQDGTAEYTVTAENVKIDIIKA